MSDPMTLALLGGAAATQGITFLYAQASELLKAWREKRAATPPASPALDAPPTPRPADMAVVEQRQRSLALLRAALSPYALGDVEIDLGDEELAARAGELRELLEAVYGQRFTFRGEQREPTGSTVTVRQVLGTVEGNVVGAKADVGGGSLRVDQEAETVRGSLLGFEGTIGRPPA